MNILNRIKTNFNIKVKNKFPFLFILYLLFKNSILYTLVNPSLSHYLNIYLLCSLIKIIRFINCSYIKIKLLFCSLKSALKTKARKRKISFTMIAYWLIGRKSRAVSTFFFVSMQRIKSFLD